MTRDSQDKAGHGLAAHVRNTIQSILFWRVRRVQAPLEKPPHHPSPFEIWTSQRDGQKYIFVPPGEFEMGADQADADAYANEKPQHHVYVETGLWVAEAPVTVRAYRRYCDATGRSLPRASTCNPGWRGDQHPMVNLTWDEAVAYCRWAGARLPSEAEWEYCARAGTATRFWWGDSFDGAMAWFRGNAAGQTHSVGAKAGSPWGLLDMLGNVWEWCADQWHATYQDAPEVAVPRNEGDQMHVLRGGSWMNGPRGLRISYRAGLAPVVAVPYCGFRCVHDGE